MLPTHLDHVCTNLQPAAWVRSAPAMSMFASWVSRSITCNCASKLWFDWGQNSSKPLLEILNMSQMPQIHCRREICLMSSPPLRTSFGSQNMRSYHDYILLLFSLFLLHENRLQFFRKHYDQILLIHTISMVVHTSGSMHCRRRYRDPELAGLLFTYFGSPSKYGDSPSFLRVTGPVTYRQIVIYEMSMTMVRTWGLGHWLGRN